MAIKRKGVRRNPGKFLHRRGWYGNKSRRYKEKAYFPDAQLKQSDKYWTINHVYDGEAAQSVSHSYYNMAKVFDQIEELYQYISNKNDDELVLDGSFSPLVGILMRNIWWLRQPRFQDIDHSVKVVPMRSTRFRMPEGRGLGRLSCRSPQIVDPAQPSTVLLAFSGGKGSVATALFYSSIGHDVRLVYVCGIDRAARDDLSSVRAVADRLSLPLYVQNLWVRGTYSGYVEHPMKNMLVANALIHFAYIHGLPPRIAFGTFEMDMLANNCFDVCGGDCRDMWDAYESIVRTAIPDFHVYTPLPHAGVALETLQTRPKMWSMIYSCTGPAAYWSKSQRRVERFFGVRPYEQDCGVCWKCAFNYVYACDMELRDDVDYHYYVVCLNILRSELDGERGYPCQSIEEVWDRFFPYPMSRSRFVDKVVRANVRGTGSVVFPEHLTPKYYGFKAFRRLRLSDYDGGAGDPVG